MLLVGVGMVAVIGELAVHAAPAVEPTTEKPVGFFDRIMNYMIADLEGCKAVQKEIKDLDWGQLNMGNELCKTKCESEGFTHKYNDYKHMGTSIYCCCQSRKATTQVA